MTMLLCRHCTCEICRFCDGGGGSRLFWLGRKVALEESEGRGKGLPLVQ